MNGPAEPSSGARLAVPAADRSASLTGASAALVVAGPAVFASSPGRLPVFLATTTNGSGMGHLSRQVAIAAALRGRADPVVFSLSTALATVVAGVAAPSTGHGEHTDRGGGSGGARLPVLRGEYCPSYHRNQMPVPDWHAYLRDRIVALVHETGASAVGFDGVTPYLGLLRARALLPEVPFIWFRRGMWRPGTNLRALRASPFFDLVIEPGDLAGCGDRGPTAGRSDAVRVPPVSVLGAGARSDRRTAARELGLDPDRPAVLVNLGAWAHRPARAGGDWWTSIAATVVRQLLSGTDWQVALTRAPIIDSELADAQTGRLHVLRDVYPLARSLDAFEAAVAEAGYNGFHELLLAGIPTLLMAKATTTDDQRARGRWAAGAGTALFAEDPTRCSREVARLLDPAVRDDLRTVCAQLPAADGATAAADLIVARMGSQTATPGGDGTFRHRASAAERRRVTVLEAKAAVSKVIGPAATDLLRSLRRSSGTAAALGPARRLPADPLLTTELDAATLRSPRPLEHLLPGSSTRYRDVRAGIAGRFYRVPPGWPDSRSLDSRSLDSRPAEPS